MTNKDKRDNWIFYGSLAFVGVLVIDIVEASYKDILDISALLIVASIPAIILFVVSILMWKKYNLLVKKEREEAALSESLQMIEEKPLSDEERIEHIRNALVGKTLKSWRKSRVSSYIMVKNDTIDYIRLRFKDSHYIVIHGKCKEDKNGLVLTDLAEMSLDDAEILIQTGEFISDELRCYIDEPWLEEEQSLEEIRFITRNIEPFFVELAKVIISMQLKSIYWWDDISRELGKEDKYIGNTQGYILLGLFKKIGFIDEPKSGLGYKVLCLRMKEFYLKCKANEDNLEQYYLDSKKEYEDKAKQRKEIIRKQREEAQIKAIVEEKERMRQRILNKERKKELRKQVMKELQEEGVLENVRKREPIPQEVQDIVWRRDGGRCVKCGSQENLEFDHIIPFSKGGSNTARNLQLLCEKCNREKSNHIG